MCALGYVLVRNQSRLDLHADNLPPEVRERLKTVLPTAIGAVILCSVGVLILIMLVKSHA
jgi:hypothetical protein